jgi:hypothetical protein
MFNQLHFFQYIIIVCTLVWYDIMIHAANISGIMLFFHVVARYATLHQNVNTWSYCIVCITHIFFKASLIPLKHDNICFIKNCFKNVAWKFILK